MNCDYRKRGAIGVRMHRADEGTIGGSFTKCRHILNLPDVLRIRPHPDPINCLRQLSVKWAIGLLASVTGEKFGKLDSRLEKFLRPNIRKDGRKTNS